MSAPTSGRPTRRRFLIQRRFQLKYMLVIVIAGAAIALLFGAIMYQVQLEVADLALPATRASDRERVVTLLVIVTAIVLAGTLALFGLLLTHRVAGPVFVIGRYLRILGEGRYPLLRPLRQDDELQEFYEAFHEAVDKLRARDHADGQLISDLATRVEQLAGPSGEASEIVDAMRRLSARKQESAESAVPPTASLSKLEAATRQGDAD